MKTLIDFIIEKLDKSRITSISDWYKDIDFSNCRKTVFDKLEELGIAKQITQDELLQPDGCIISRNNLFTNNIQITYPLADVTVNGVKMQVALVLSLDKKEWCSITIKRPRGLTKNNPKEFFRIADTEDMTGLLTYMLKNGVKFDEKGCKKELKHYVENSDDFDKSMLNTARKKFREYTTIK